MGCYTQVFKLLLWVLVSHGSDYSSMTIGNLSAQPSPET
jgi:hypothetical protein